MRQVQRTFRFAAKFPVALATGGLNVFIDRVLTRQRKPSARGQRFKAFLLAWALLTLALNAAAMADSILAVTATPAPTVGTVWVQATARAAFGQLYCHSSVVFHDQMWVIGGIVNSAVTNNVLSSTDGVTWTQALSYSPVPARYGHTSVVFNDRMWIIGGASSSPGVFFNDVWSSSDGKNWTLATGAAAFSARHGHSSVVFKDKMWVIGGWDSTGAKNDVWCSSDGTTWTQVTAAAAFSPRANHTSVVFDNKMWVISGGSDGIWFSDDGATWTQIPVANAFPYRFHHASVVYDNQIWVIGGANGYEGDIWHSPDGLNWTQAPESPDLPPRSDLTSVVFQDKLWVIGGYGRADVWYSPRDGVTPTPTPTPTPAPEPGIAWIRAQNSNFFPTRQDHASVVFNNKMWVIGGWDGKDGMLRKDVWSSADGITWNEKLHAAPFAARRKVTSLVFANKMWVIGGYNNLTLFKDVWSSPDGVNWTQETAAAPFPDSFSYAGVVFNNKMWLVGSYFGDRAKSAVWYSSDGITWLQATNAADFSYRIGHTCVVFNNKMWVIGGLDPGNSLQHDVWSSPDGVTWTCEAANPAFPARAFHTCAVFGNEMWIISGQGNVSDQNSDVWHSADGKTWTQATNAAAVPMRHNHTSVVFNDKFWVIAGAIINDIPQNDVWSSTNGADWLEATNGGTYTSQFDPMGAAFNNEMWLFSGHFAGNLPFAEAWHSPDGVTWTAANSSIPRGVRSGGSCAVFNNRLWLIAGGDWPSKNPTNDVWASADGAVWTCMTPAAGFSRRYGQSTLVFDNKLWVIGGYGGAMKNDVWSSADGVTWNLVTNEAAFPAREGHSSVVFDNKMWVIGGNRGNQNMLNDAWYSSDGVQWVQATPNAAFSRRANHASLVFDNKIWVIGGLSYGYSSTQYLGDVWSSPDGVTWTQATSAAAFGPRADHAGLVFNNTIWVLGGANSPGNDAWYSYQIPSPPTPTPTATPPPTATPTPTPTPLWIWAGGSSLENQSSIHGPSGTADPAYVPGGRYGVASSTDPSGRAWLFGGLSQVLTAHEERVEYYLNELWRFDPATGTWIWLRGSSELWPTGEYGEIGIESPGNTPGGRLGSSLWSDSAGQLWLFGGQGFDNWGSPDGWSPSGYLNDLWRYNPATNNWTWMKGSDTANQGGIYGTQGAEGPANTPGARNYATSWTDSSGRFWLFGGGMLNSQYYWGAYHDLWRFDPHTGNWTWVKGSQGLDQPGTYGIQGVASPDNLPPGRLGAAAWTDPAGRLWLFGGISYQTGYDAKMNDLWCFDPATNNWTWIKGADFTGQRGAYGTQGIEDPANTPGARNGASAWVDPAGRLWLFGGYGLGDSGEGSLNDLWRFDPATGNWAWIGGSKKGNQLGIYGTQGQPAPGYGPGGRLNASGWAEASGRLWLFGGSGYADSGSGMLNDLWYVDTQPIAPTPTPTPPSPTPTPTPTPTPLTLTWRQATANAGFSSRAAHASVVFDNKMWVLGGWDGINEKHDVWWSSDGTTWHLATANAGFSPRYGLTGLVYNNKMWVIGGRNYNDCYNDVWWSTDGVQWHQANSFPGPGRFCHAAVAFKDKIWVMDGWDPNSSFSDVWATSDTLTWNSPTGEAPFGQRYAPGLVFRDRMWILGGYSRGGGGMPGSERIDVWWSKDGQHWNAPTSDNMFGNRVYHSCVALDDKMLVIGGITDKVLNDVWWSRDGATWQQAISENPFPPRGGHSSVVYDNKIWVIGGGNGSGNDVWYATIPTPTPTPTPTPSPTPSPTPTPTPIPPPMLVLAPNGGEVLPGGAVIDIQWRTDPPTAGTAVRVELRNGQGWVADLGSHWQSDGCGTCQFYLPLLPERSDYRVRTVSAWNPALWDESDAPFTITGGPLRLCAPNGGETWTAGTRVWVWWEANPDIAGTAVRLELWRGGAKVANLGEDWQPDGAGVCMVTVPAAAPGSNYTVRAVSLWDENYKDASDAPLTLRNDTWVPLPQRNAVSTGWTIFE